MNPLADAWQDAINAFAATATELSDAAFAAPSLLPGWTIGDIVAHVAALEVELAGHPLAAHEPDWDALPHAATLFSRYTEIGVDVRRGWTAAHVRAELAAAIAERALQLRDADPGATIVGIGGRPLTLDQQLRMRCFDIVVHDLDIRDALGMPGPRLGAGAAVCVAQIADALGYVWAKKAAAQPGQVLHVRVPGWLERWIEVGQDGRGRAAEPGAATVALVVPVMEFMRLGSGRTAQISGDDDMGQRLVANLNVAP